jgi:uncharacterized membrane protein YedE/YeeE
VNAAAVRALAGLLTGLIFGAGLVVSQMADPNKVLAFLDIFGRWDASLALVMGGALVVTGAGFRWVGKRKPLFDTTLHLPTRRDIDARLLTGAAVFGVGWGIAGYCPGPAVTALTINPAEAVPFVVAMVVGGLIERRFRPRH